MTHRSERPSAHPLNSRSLGRWACVGQDDNEDHTATSTTIRPRGDRRPSPVHHGQDASSPCTRGFTNMTTMLPPRFRTTAKMLPCARVLHVLRDSQTRPTCFPVELAAFQHFEARQYKTMQVMGHERKLRTAPQRYSARLGVTTFQVRVPTVRNTHLGGKNHQHQHRCHTRCSKQC